MLARIITILYFLIGLIVALNGGYLGGGVGFDADSLWRLANFVLAIGFWPLLVLSPYHFDLPDALLRR